MRLPARCAIALVALLAVTGCAGGISGTPAVGTGVVGAAGSGSSSAGTATPSTGTATPGSGTTGSGPPGSATPGSATPGSGTSSATSSSADETLASGVTIDELADDMASAQEIVNGYWTQHWTDFYTGSWNPPRVEGLYDGTDPADTPSCDGVPLETENAYYCESGDYLAWDASLLVEGADQIGDSWVYLVIAHEYGHAVQARLDPSEVATGYELQADCLGAAALYGAVADGTLKFELGDEQELINSLSALADQMAWTMSADHGDPFQRVQWFTLGRNGGVNACHDVLATSDGATTESAPTTA